MGQQEHRREPLSDAHARLGAALRDARERARRTTREIPDYSSGHISNVENGCVTPSEDLVHRYVAIGGDQIVLYALLEMVRRYSSEKRRSRYDKHPTDLPVDRQSCSETQLSLRYLVEEDDSSYFFSSSGVVQEVRVVHAVRALKPDVSIFYAGAHHYAADRRRGVLTAQAGLNCSIAYLEESQSGQLKVFLRFPAVLDPTDNESHAFSYRIGIETEVQSSPLLQYEPVGPVIRYTVRAQFRPPALPNKIWWFSAANRSDVESDPIASNIFGVDTGGYYFKTFHNLIPGWRYGLAWLWQTPDSLPSNS